MSSVLIVPVHPPKLLNLINLLHSCNQLNTRTPIWLVCTTNAEADQIAQAVHTSNAASHLQIQIQVVETWSKQVLGSTATEYLLQNQNTCVVNFKKFAALCMLHEASHQLAVMIDADAVCMSSLDAFMRQAHKNYLKRMWWGCVVDDNSIGIGACTLSTQMLGEAAHASSKQKGIMNIYNWFLDPPTYLVHDVKKFFDHMIQVHGDLSSFFMKTSWFTFDFLVFSQWLAYTNQAEIRDYSLITGVNTVPEILDVHMLEQLRQQHDVTPAWCSTAAFLKSPNQLRLRLPYCHMMYHVDRPHVL